MIEKPTLNVAFFGHVDAGKSTLAGRLLNCLGTINDEIIDRLKSSAMQIGMSSFCYANVLSRTKDEIQRGRTIEIAHSRAETKNYYLNIIDLPVGYFMKGMIRGMSQANVGIIVVDAEAGAFEAGLQTTREMLCIAKSLGVIQMIFCINKMDSLFVYNPEGRFQEISIEIAKLSKRASYSQSPVIIPIGAWNMLNILEPCEKFSWFKGPTLLDVINSLKVPNYPSQKPLRIPILEVYNLKDVGTVVFGKVESGTLNLDTKIRFSNGKTKIADGTVESIQIFRKPVTEASAGQLVTIKLNNVKYEDLKVGMILSDVDNNPAREIVSFEGEIAVLKCPNAIRKFYKPTFHCYTLQTRCEFNNLLESSKVPDKSEKEENPRLIRQGRYATVLFKPDHPIYLEPFDSFPPFGRFTIRDNGHLVCVGIVKKVNYDDSSTSATNNE